MADAPAPGQKKGTDWGKIALGIVLFLFLGALLAAAIYALYVGNQ